MACTYIAALKRQARYELPKLPFDSSDKLCKQFDRRSYRFTVQLSQLQMGNLLSRQRLHVHVRLRGLPPTSPHPLSYPSTIQPSPFSDRGVNSSAPENSRRGVAERERDLFSGNEQYLRSIQVLPIDRPNDRSYRFYLVSSCPPRIRTRVRGERVTG